MNAIPSRKYLAPKIFLTFTLIAVSTVIFGCGGSSGTSENSLPGTTPGNVAAITVNGGPDSNFVNGAFTSVTVCTPGSTTNCQTIGGILVDTGSYGLRILSSALTVPLTQQTDSGGNSIAECAVFGSGITWGPVQTADVKIAGEKASSLPIQVIGSSSFSTIPQDCSVQGMPMDDQVSLGANGLLGVGESIQDFQAYYACPPSGCSTLTTQTTESPAQQVQNPVAFFATDNNGVIVELPAVSGEEASVSGSLIFGIGTQSNNGLGSATVFGTDAFGDFHTTYKSAAYQSFLDTGSSVIYFLDATTTGIPVCTNATINTLYCPASAQTVSVVNDAQPGTNGASGSVTFSVNNALTLLQNNSTNAAVIGLAGPDPNMFDFGLPFFFGRNVYVAIEGKSTPGGTGPYTAY